MDVLAVSQAVSLKDELNISFMPGYVIYSSYKK